MGRLEIFDYLMGVFDRWTEEEPERYGGSFKNLRKGVGVRELIVTPNCSVSVSMLKTYFAMEVLQIYQRNTRSKVSWKDIQRSLAGEAKKKYSFDFTELDKCFSAKENKMAAGRTQLLAEYSRLEENEEGWKDAPVYLLERLQEMFRKKLGAYLCICDLEHDDPDARREKYKECLIMLSLHEIFVREYAQICSRRLKEARQRGMVFNKTFDKLVEAGGLFGGADTDGKKILAKQVRNQTQESMEYIKWIGAFWILQLLWLEHNIALEAEIQLVMLLELKKLDEMGGSREENIWGRVEKYLEFMKDKYLDDYVNYNKNKVKFYRRLEADVQKIFLNFMSTIPLPEKNAVSHAIRDYLELVEQGAVDDERRKQLWLAQCIMVRPLTVNSRKSDV